MFNLGSGEPEEDQGSWGTGERRKWRKRQRDAPRKHLTLLLLVQCQGIGSWWKKTSHLLQKSPDKGLPFWNQALVSTLAWNSLFFASRNRLLPKPVPNMHQSIFGGWLWLICFFLSFLCKIVILLYNLLEGKHTETQVRKLTYASLDFSFTELYFLWVVWVVFCCAPCNLRPCLLRVFVQTNPSYLIHINLVVITLTFSVVPNTP